MGNRQRAAGTVIAWRQALQNARKTNGQTIENTTCATARQSAVITTAGCLPFQQQRHTQRRQAVQHHRYMPGSCRKNGL